MIPLIVFLLACLAAYLGVIEAGFSALMRLPLRIAAERRDRPGALGVYLDDPLLLFIPTRLLLGLVTGAATALLAWAAGDASLRALTLVVLGMAAFVFVFGILLPLVIVGRDPEGVLEVLLPTFDPVARALSPLTRWIVHIRPGAAESGGPETAAQPADAAHESATADVEERRLLQSIVDFGDTLVREVMTPRPDVVAIRDTATIAELRALFKEQEYSRFPVYKESLDNIAGFVFVKDLLTLNAPDDRGPIAPLLRPAVVVPETQRVPELLKQFQHEHTQCAIVVDEYGGTAGLVTLEDVLEEIVGEIRDEYDVEVEPIVEEAPRRYVFNGRVKIEEVEQRLEVEIERKGFETVGGYLLAHIGRVPAAHERFEVDGLAIEILGVERRRIQTVRITKTVTTEDTEGTEE
ncbi:MAG: HlyC/CorC family transporter [Acidobacteria bacterium]|nr:HlyC/CorC family transporter [Acidobacteriota bacterium]